MKRPGCKQTPYGVRQGREYLGWPMELPSASARVLSLEAVSEPRSPAKRSLCYATCASYGCGGSLRTGSFKVPAPVDTFPRGPRDRGYPGSISLRHT
eukprot:2330235-Alexandrium_andersonii.AAC.1